MNKIFEEMKAQTVPDENTVNTLIESLPDKQPKKGIKFPHVAIAIAAAVSMQTVTAGAASNWTFSFLSDFSSIFGGNTAEYNIVESASYSNSESDMSFELVGVAVDSNLFRAMVDIYPPEETEFTEDNKPKINSDISFGICLKDYHDSYWTGGNFYILSDTPQKMRVMLTYDCSTSFENKNIEFTARKMTGFEVCESEDSELKERSYIWYTNIKTGSSTKKQTYSLDDMIVRYNETTFIEATSAEISGMTATINCKMFGDDYHLLNQNVYVTLTDGSTIGAICAGTGGSYIEGTVVGNIIFLFDEVVKPTDVVSITTDGHEIKIR